MAPRNHALVCQKRLSDHNDCPLSDHVPLHEVPEGHTFIWCDERFRKGPRDFDHPGVAEFKVTYLETDSHRHPPRWRAGDPGILSAATLVLPKGIECHCLEFWSDHHPECPTLQRDTEPPTAPPTEPSDVHPPNHPYFGCFGRPLVPPVWTPPPPEPSSSTYDRLVQQLVAELGSAGDRLALWIEQAEAGECGDLDLAIELCDRVERLAREARGVVEQLREQGAEPCT